VARPFFAARASRHDLLPSPNTLSPCCHWLVIPLSRSRRTGTSRVLALPSARGSEPEQSVIIGDGILSDSMTVIFYVTYTVYCLGSSKCLHFTAFDFPRIFKLSTLPLARSGNSAQSQCSSEDGRDGKASCYLPHCAFCIETDSGRAVQPTSAVTPSCYRETQPWPTIIGRIDKSSCGELKPSGALDGLHEAVFVGNPGRAPHLILNSWHTEALQTKPPVHPSRRSRSPRYCRLRTFR
jgi:hypothetical protein